MATRSISAGWFARSLSKRRSARTHPNHCRVPSAAARARFRPHAWQRHASHAAVVAARLRRVGLPHRRRGARAPDHSGRRRRRAPDHRQPEDADAGAAPTKSSRPCCACAQVGPGAVTAADICSRPAASASSIRTHHLFTHAGRSRPQRRTVREQGPWLRRSDQHPADKSLPVDLVRIDAIYNPVRRANFTVAETRVGQRTDYDRLTLTVETNGTMSPEEAVSYAAALAQTHFQYFVGFGSSASLRSLARRRRRDGDGTPAGRAVPHADRRSRTVGSLGQLAQEFQHPLAR